jgi:argininosuccinate synthase
MKTIRKVVLAYSGGLDTSCAVRWIKDTYGAEVICFSAFIGEVANRSLLAKRARSAGASKVYIEDLKKEFVDEYVRPALWARAKYESGYFLATALGRPLIAKRLVQIAVKERADAVAHGCSGKGNDQVRIEVGVRSLSPNLKILAPLREWTFNSRDEEIEYAKKHNLLVQATKSSPYSVDKNIWGLSVEAGVLEDPWVEPPPDTYLITKPLADVSRKPLYVTLDFKKGVPVSLNGKRMSLVSLIEQLTEWGGRYGIGRLDLIENRLVGIKSREIYEAPQAEILHAAHEALESLVLDRETLHYRRILSEKYSELVYNGLWFSMLREALDDFFASYQNRMTGTVRLKLEAGRASVVGRRSPNSLYSKSLATYSEQDAFDRNAAEGFMKIWGLPYERVQK